MVSMHTSVVSHLRTLSLLLCDVCGKEAYCIRRQPVKGQEAQTFECSGCGRVFSKVRAIKDSDYD